MGARAEFVTGIPDTVKWLIAAAVLVASVAAFYYYADQSLLLRVIGLLVAVAASVAVGMQTDKGRIAWEFVRESRTEVRKVVWPTRKETVQTTVIVFVVVTLVALFLWMLDGALAWGTRTLLGGGG